MKIKKLLPEQVKDKTLGYKDYRKVLKPALQAMETACTSAETATDCLIKTDFVFSDMPGKKMGLIIVGKQSGAWLKGAKDEAKNDKKFTLLGKCYMNTNGEGVKTLVVLPTKGGAKTNLIKRQVSKFALKGYPYEFSVGAVVVEEENLVSSKGSDTTTTSESTTEPQNLTAEQEERKRVMNARMQKMDEQISKLKAQFKLS